ncbi:MAG: alpha-amylase family glycosyl hydrolase [Eubacteriales bacterium]
MNIIRGDSLPLGVTIDGNRINFSVEVSPKSECKLLLFKRGDSTPSYTYELEKDLYISETRSLQIEDIDPDIVGYHYLINKELYLDPYSKELIGRNIWNTETNGIVYTKLLPIKSNGILEIYQKSKHLLHKYEWLNIPEAEVIAYQLHVRGFTKHSTSKVKAKGKFLGIVEKIPYLLELGINQIQLLPCHEFKEDGLYVNYWGYLPGCYMAVKSSYSHHSDVNDEFLHLVEELHKHRIEIILDMPFIEAPALPYQIECLRYFISNYNIDGFLLNPYKTNLEEIKLDPIIRTRKLIIRDEGFQNASRSFLKGDEGRVGDIIHFLQKPSIECGISRYNYIASHDGFTMNDFVSYDRKHNELNGEKNTDGKEYNFCWNCGAEGPTRKKVVQELRKKQIRNAWTILLLAQGTPCILSGDEFSNTQMGNNNAYCQDNDISWLNWKFLQKNTDVFEFVKQLIQIRKVYTHTNINETGECPIKSSVSGIPTISYHGESAWITPDEVASRQLGIMYASDEVNLEDCYIAYNMHWIAHKYALPTISKDKTWYRMLSTATSEIGNAVELENQRVAVVEPRSIEMYISKTSK